jgi:hypothetical protein
METFGNSELRARLHSRFMINSGRVITGCRRFEERTGAHQIILKMFSRLQTDNNEAGRVSPTRLK